MSFKDVLAKASKGKKPMPKGKMPMGKGKAPMPKGKPNLPRPIGNPAARGTMPPMPNGGGGMPMPPMDNEQFPPR